MSERPISSMVGVVASAGGLEALKRLCASLPTDRGLCFLIIQHLEPNHKSMLADILSRHAALKVKQAEDGETLDPDTILTIPPGRYMSVDQEKVILSSVPENRINRMTADHLLESIAEWFGDRGVGVVLSGTGSDGTGGIKAIREHGGLTIAQDPEEAEYDGMPRSAIRSGNVDQVLELREMPEAILNFDDSRARRPLGERTEREENLEEVLAYVREYGGYDLSEYKRATLQRRVERRMGLRQVREIGQYLQLLRSEPGELRDLARDLLISVTRFFRDPQAFKRLEEAVEDTFGSRDASKNAELRAWVPGCATGEEAYSIAVVLLEHVRRTGSSARVQVFGSDLDRDALATARQGVYGEYVSGQVPAEYLSRYFVEVDAGYRVSKRLRESVLFSPQNLLQDPPFSHLDLVSCRNVVIYLRREVHDRLFATFHFALRGTGLLFLGNAESLGSNDSLFATLDRTNKVYRRREHVSPRSLRALYTGRSGPSRRQSKETESKGTENGGPESKALRAIAEVFGPAAVTVDPDDHLQFIHGQVGEYLDFPAGEPRYEISKLLRSGLRARVLAAIRAVRRGDSPVDEIVNFRTSEGWKSVRLVVRFADEAAGLILVAFDEQKTIELEQPEEADSAAATVIRALEQEIESSHAELRDTIEEMESSNEELKTSNEESLSMNEELQSTNEELETSKEELQSLNEELQTVNNELEEKVQQLERVNQDVRNLYASSQMSIMLFDRDLRLRRFSPEAVQLFGVSALDEGRRFSSLPSTITEKLDVNALRETLATGKSSHEDVKLGRDRWFLRRVLPYQDEAGSYEGVIVTFADISDLKRVQERSDELLNSYRTLTENSQDVIARFNRDHKHIFVNKEITALTELRPEDYYGKSNRDLGFPDDLCALWEEKIEQAFQTGKRQHGKFSVDGPDEVVHHFDWMVIPEHTGDEPTVLTVARDVTELVNSLDSLQSALDDRDVMIREVHHRVKNNLFLLIGLLGMERNQLSAGPADAETVVAAFENVISRVHVISEIYQHLYQSSGQARTVFGPDYFRGLMDLISQAHSESSVDIDLAVEPVDLSVDTAIPLGLIVNEAATNSFKYGFPDGAEGVISVKLEQLDDTSMRLLVEDNGVGVESEEAVKPGLGRVLISTLSEQIDGTLDQSLVGGAKISVTFPVSEDLS